MDPIQARESLVELLERRAAARPEAPLYTFLLEGEAEARELTYGQLATRARAVAVRLHQVAQPGDRALLLCEPGLDYIAAFFGCLYARVIAVPAYPPNPARLERTLPRLQAIAEDARTSVVLTTTPILEMKEGFAGLAGSGSILERMRWVAVDGIPESEAERWAAPEVGQGSVAFLQYTSGSTSSPKGVVLTHGNLLNNLEVTSRAFGTGPSSRAVIWLPPYHDMGLIGGLMQPLYGGFPVTLMSPLAFLERPLRWLEAMSRTRATVSGGPNFAYELCVRKSTPEERARLDLRSWEVAFTGAEPIRPETLDRFVEAFAPSGFRRETFFPCYGLAEGTLFITGGRRGEPPSLLRLDAEALQQHQVRSATSGSAAATLVGCGSSPREQRVLVVDPETRAVCPPERIGEIWVAGPSVAQGYWQRPEESQATFAAALASGEGPFLRTGDLGFLSGEELVVTGRLKDLIIIRGRNHYPQDLERTVEGCHPAIRAGCCVAFSVEAGGEERVVAAAEVRPGSQPELIYPEVLRAVSEGHELKLHDVVLLAPGGLPKTSSGKVQRRACKAGYLAGTLEEVARMSAGAEAEGSAPAPGAEAARPALSAAEAERWLLTRVQAGGRVTHGASAAAPLASFGIDSLGIVNLAHEVEQELGAALPLARYLQASSLSALAAEIVSARAEQAVRGGHEDETRLSEGERALWFLQRLSPGSTAYHVSRAVRISGALKVEWLESAFAEVIARHEALRTTFPAVDGAPRRLIHPRGVFQLEQEQALGVAEVELRRRASAWAAEPFDLEGGPLLRARLFTLESGQSLLVVNVHHMVCDFWSLGLVFEEVRTVYTALSEGREPRLPAVTHRYVDHIAWQRRWLGSSEGDKSLAHWRQVLSGELPVLDLPTDFPRPEQPAFMGDARSLLLSPRVAKGIRTLAEATGTSLYTALLACFQVLLHRYSGQDDVVVGSPFAGRGRQWSSRVVGYFVNPISLRARFSEEQTFLELLREMKQTVTAALAEGDYPFALLPSKLEVPRTGGRSPIFQVMFDLQWAPQREEEGLTALAHGTGQGSPISFGPLKLAPFAMEQRSAQFDLTLAATELPEGLSLVMEYDTALFKPESVDRLLQSFAMLVETAARAPGERVAALPLLRAEQRERLLRASHGTQVEVPEESLEQCIAVWAGKRPETPAVISGGQVIGHRELRARVELLAAKLLAQGVDVDERVGILLPRSAEFVSSALATLEAGGAYVALDPSHPAERLWHIVRSAGIRVLVTSPSFAGAMGPVDGVSTRVEELLVVRMGEARSPAGSRTAASEHLAYVSYTSGSTGEPKGVMISRGALHHHAEAISRAYALSPEDRVLHFAAVTFDVAVEELFPTLLSGASIVVRPDDVGDVRAFLGFVRTQGVTVLNLPASYWHELVTVLVEERLAFPESVRLVVVGSEAVRADRVRAWDSLGLKGVRLLNGYGPTEATVTATTHEHRSPLSGEGFPIGRPLGNVQALVLDQELNPVPPGVIGELYLAGQGLARGYLGRPELTAELFLPNPHARDEGGRMYRTGDLARVRPDGLLEFAGRADQQLKVRGFRIEPAEVESVLAAEPSIRECVVVARQEGGAARLVAYLVPASPETFSLAPVQEALARRLPAYLIPTAFSMLPTLPRLPSGKVDRRALPAPEVTRTERRTVTPPRTPIEKSLVEVWKSVLRVQEVGIDDNFFDLGGESILAIQMISRARQAGLGLTTAQIFQHQTIARLATVVVPLAAASTEPRPEGEVPLLPIQQDFFALEMQEPHHWNQEVLLRLAPAVAPRLMRRALEAVVSAHDAFRLRFERSESAWRQFYEPAPARTLAWIDSEEACISEKTAQAVRASLELGRGPLCGAALVGGELFIAIHHLVVDAVSWRILLEDLTLAYRQLQEGRPVELPPAGTSYQRWSRALETHARSEALRAQAAYWDAQCTDVGTELPRDMPGASVESSAEELSVSASSALTHQLVHELAVCHRLSVQEVLLAALTRVLRRWSGHPAVLIDVEGHGREPLEPSLDLSRTVGWFTSVFPFRLDGPVEEPLALLAHVKAGMRAVPERGLSHGLLRAPRGSGAQLLFNYLGQLELDARGSELFTPVEAALGSPRSPAAARSHLLTLDCAVQGGRLHFTWGFSAEVHRRETIARLAEHLLGALEHLAEAALSARTRLLSSADFPLAGLPATAFQALAASCEDLEDVYPLSPVQESMLFHHLYSPESGVTVEQSVFRVLGALDVEAFERAWQAIFERHPSLRATVHWQGLPHPVQAVHGGLKLPISRLDWRDRSPEQAQAELQALLAEDRKRGYELSRPPLMRLFLIRRADTEWEVVWSHHHLVIDGYSLPVVVRELDALYASFVSGHPARLEAPRPYRDYIAWQKQQDLQAAEAFWREQLQGFTTPVRLMQAGTHQSVGTGAVGRAEALADAGLQARLREVARQHRVTLSTLVQSAWALLLSRYSGQKDIVFGSTTSGRPSAVEHVETVVGCFMNTLPRRVQLSAGQPVSELLREFQRQQEAVRQFEFTPLAMVRTWSEVPRVSALYDLYETVVVFEDYPLEELLERGLGGLKLRKSDFEAQLDYPLVLYVFPQPQLRFLLVADLTAVNQAWAELMLRRLVELLEAMAEQPSAALAELKLVRGEARAQLDAWNRTSRPMPEEPVFARVDAHAARTPDAPAVIFEDQVLTYAQLKDRSDRLAALLRSHGIGPEMTVGLFFDRSLESMIGTFGVLKAGAAYVPIDPAYPADRIAYMIGDARSPLILTQRKLAERLPEHAGTTLCLDEPGLLDGVTPVQPVAINPDWPAYVIYTSGSTGRPKGVQVTHRNIVNSTFCRYHALPSVPESYLLLAPFSFDAAGCGIYWTLQSGGALVLPPESLRENALEIPRLIEQHRITHLSFTPSLYSAVLDVAAPGQLATLRLVIVAGETLPPALVERHHRVVPQAVLFNEYGPTECTIWSTVHDCVPEHGLRNVPIGRALTNMQVLILDERLNRVPPGFIGEIYIRGENMARGYHRRPELTAERFLPDPHAERPGGRMYRTGDLGRYRPDGAIEFLGRVDQQVKIRGFRIEPAEVEVALEAHPDIRDRAVVARVEGGEARLVAYLVVRAGAEQPSVGELRRFLGRTLPEYLVPSAFVFLEALPLSPNGKVDRSKLPAPVLERQSLERPLVAPRNATEQAVARIWAEVLDVAQVGVEDSFFDIGGHSLKATQVVSRLREALQVELPLRALFEAPTIAGLSERIQALQQQAVAGPEAISPRPRSGELPLSFAQQRLWFLDQLEPGSAAYNIPLALRLTGRIDVPALQRAFDEVVRRHEAIRTTFPSVEGLPLQRIAPPFSLELGRMDLRAVAVAAREAELARVLAEEAGRSFSLAEGPLLRACLVALAEEEHVLLLTMHHIISDGWSMGVLVREMTEAYAALSRGQTPSLPPLPIQYADYAAWQREHLRGEVLERQLAYWRERLSGELPVLQLPTTRPRPAFASARGATERLELSEEQTRAVHELARAEGVTPFMVLHAAFSALLHRYSGQEDIVVGTPIANRHRAEVEPLVGFFVNTLALRTDLSGDPSFGELLARAREATLGAYAHQDIPFEALVEALQPARELGRTPFFQVMLVVQNAPMPALSVSGLTISPLTTDSATAKFDLTLFLEEEEGRMLAAWEYRTDLFDAAAVQRMHAHFTALLGGCVSRPQERLSRLPLLPAEERRLLLSQFSQGPLGHHPQPLAHELFEAQVARTPEAVAVECGTERLTYRELDRRANRLARVLRARGVGPDVCVGLCLERSNELVTAILAVLKAGGAYLPLDPSYPRERLAFMVEQAGVPVLLTSARLRELLPPHSAEVLFVEADMPVSAQDDAPPGSGVSPRNLAYVLYTSGSTGTPKGVMVSHEGLANYLAWCAEAYGPGSGEGAPVHSPIGFDLTVTSLFAPLLAGRKAVLVPDGTEVEGLVRALREGGTFSLVKLTPAHLELLRHQLAPEEARRARALVIGGEALVAESLRFWREHAPGIRLINEYGPTETVVGCCTFEVPAGPLDTSAVPIGKPILNTRLYVLDTRLEPVPVGVVGELYIGGAGVARGYLGRPELTAERFVPDPFSATPGARMYRSGDLARYLPDGNLDFLGRADQQVKIRGFRIELEEIQSTLERHPAVTGAAVVARDDLPGGRQLVAYVTLAPEKRPGTEELKGFLAGKLPAYMVPAWFVVLEALPLTVNGKVDRSALPAPVRGVGKAAPVPARTPTEEALAEMFTEVLGLPSVGVHDSFFELGGHSLLATQLMARVRARFEVPLQIRDVFQTPTIAHLGQLIDETLAKQEAALQAQLEEEIAQLSEEEVERRLRELEAEEQGGTG